LANIVLGKMNRDFEAAEVIWNFFKDKLLKPDLTHTNKEYGRNPSGEVMLFSF
jgi:hypothetical protein